MVCVRRRGPLRPHQQIAVLGIVVNTRGPSPRKKPFQPLRLLIIEAASHNPLAFLISSSCAVPLVCNNVLTTSNGVVIPAATAPARPPAVQCVKGSYFLDGFSTFDNDSYAVNWIAVKGIVMVNVVG